MVAVKENRAYTITEVDAPSFQREGYDILDDEGNVVAYGAGKTVPYEEYAKLMKRVESLQSEINDLNEKLKKRARAKKEEPEKEE